MQMCAKINEQLIKRISWEKNKMKNRFFHLVEYSWHLKKNTHMVDSCIIIYKIIVNITIKQ